MARSLSIRQGVALVVMLFASCATKQNMNLDRQQLTARLEHEMATQKSWPRIHAADGLLDNGESTNQVVAAFQPERDAGGPYRVGTWRVLARATSGEERAQYIEQIRKAFRDPNASDRLSAVETLCKLKAGTSADREMALVWLQSADDATAAFPRWLMVLTANRFERERDEAALAGLLGSPEPTARLRAAYALGRINPISADSISRLHAQLKLEPANSTARVYLITALLLHERDGVAIAELEAQLQPYFKGAVNEQYEAALATGMRGLSEGIALLRPLLESPEADARIGAAIGLLRLTK